MDEFAALIIIIITGKNLPSGETMFIFRFCNLETFKVDALLYYKKITSAVVRPDKDIIVRKKNIFSY